MKVVAFHTDDENYWSEAKRFRKSLDKVGMDYEIRVYPSQETWDDAVALKPEYLLDRRLKLRGPLLYIDVDAVVHINCAEYFDNLDCDFGVHWLEGTRLLSGTLYFGDTDNAEILLRKWIGRNDFKRRHGDKTGGGQRNLWEIISEGKVPCLRMIELPVEYCYSWRLNERFPGKYQNITPIIEHTLASRENRGVSKGNIDPKRRARIQELENAIE